MYVVTSCWFSGFTSLPRTWFCTHLLRQTKLSTSRFEHVMLFTFILDLPCQLREKLARGWSDTLYICEGDTSYICEGDQNLQIFQRVPRTRPGEGICCCLSALSCLWRALSRVAWNAGCKFLRPFFATVVDYACIQGPSPTSQGLSLMLPKFLQFVWDEKDTNPPLTLLTAGPRVLSFVASVASCKVAKLYPFFSAFIHTQNSTPASQGFLHVTKIPSARLQILAADFSALFTVLLAVWVCPRVQGGANSHDSADW